MTGTSTSVINVENSNPKAITVAIEASVALPVPPPITNGNMARTVVNVDIKMGRNRIGPAVSNASRNVSPERRT